MIKTSFLLHKSTPNKTLIRLIVTGLIWALASVSSAIETVGSLRGVVQESSGSPIVAARVQLRHTKTGYTRSITTQANGFYTFLALEPGGPYSLTFQSENHQNQVVEGVFISLGETSNLSVQLDSSIGQSLEEVVVVGKKPASSLNALGPSAAFDLGILEGAPAINRDLRDVIRLDPRVYIDEANVDAIICAGGNPRFNSLTVDGARLNDLFGLNSNGYPTQNSPFSFDVLQEVSVEFAPFDVQYSGFSSCNINAVTKSGDNDFHLSFYFDYASNNLTGSSLDGESVDLGEFNETRFAFLASRPLIKDKLFLLVSYETQSGADIFDRGYAGSGASREIQGLSMADYNEILRIATDEYNYEPGDIVDNLANKDEKLFVKLTANISDGQRATFSFIYNDGFNNTASDNDDDEFEFSNHYYTRGATLLNFTAQLFSDWNDSLSTEIRIGYQDVDSNSVSLGGTDFGEVQISTTNDHDDDGALSLATVYLGADDSRHANKVRYSSLSLKFLANYSWHIHTFTAGFEHDAYDFFNLFIQEAEGEYRFSSVADFAAGTPNRITYENAAPSNIPDDAAATYAYAINSLYVQDELYFGDTDFTIVAGLRLDFYTSNSLPRENTIFTTRYGFSNVQNLDGKSLLQPRISIDWGVTEDLSVRVGFGIFSGGNPNVWIGNNYSNDGITQVEEQERRLEAGTLLDADGNPVTLFTSGFFNGDGEPIYDIPQSLFDLVASGSADSSTNVLDPDFKIPSSAKWNLGLSYNFAEFLFNTDLTLSNARNSAIIRDLDLIPVLDDEDEPVFAPDGRPVYMDVRGRNSYDYLLTNVEGADASQTVFSLSLSRAHDFGLSWAVGYAYTDANDVNPMTSSVAVSNFANLATADPNNPGVATSNYEIKHRVTLRLQYETEWASGFAFNATLFGSHNSGRPYSFVFDEVGGNFGDFAADRHLLYVPTGADDPNVVFNPSSGIEGTDDFVPAFDQNAFFAFVDENGLVRGTIAPRNSFNSSSWTKFDLKVDQSFTFKEILGKKLTGKVFLIVENLGNLLNNSWGLQSEASFPRTIRIVDAEYDTTTEQFTFNTLLDPSIESTSSAASLWEIRIGFKIDI